MSVILFSNLKGGVAKTTNAVAVAECLASQGKPTLLIDADHQCTAGEALIGEPALIKLDRKRRTLHDLLKDMMNPDFDSTQFASYVVPEVSNIGGGLECLSLLPCSVRIDDFVSNYARGGHGFKEWSHFRSMFDANGREFRKWLKSRFAYTIIDCPPSLALQVRLLLKITDAYVVPCQPNRFSIRGAMWLKDRIEKQNFRKSCLGVLWSMVRGNDATHQRFIESPPAELVTPFETHIPLAANISNATTMPESSYRTFRGKYGSRFGQVYELLCEEIIDRIQQQPNLQKINRKTKSNRASSPT